MLGFYHRHRLYFFGLDWIKTVYSLIIKLWFSLSKWYTLEWSLGCKARRFGLALYPMCVCVCVSESFYGCTMCNMPLLVWRVSSVLGPPIEVSCHRSLSSSFFPFVTFSLSLSPSLAVSFKGLRSLCNRGK